MKKKFRKFFAVVAATVMVLAMGMVSVNASDVQPRGPLCPCGGTLLPSKSYSTWVTYKSVKCVHGYAYGTDRHQKRTVTTTMKCNRCGSGYTTGTTTETRVQCTGHN